MRWTLTWRLMLGAASLLAVAGCGALASTAGPGTPGAPPVPLSSLPPLPLQGRPNVVRVVSDTATLDGYPAFMDSGAPYVYNDAMDFPTWLVLNGRLAGCPDFIWAIWQFPVTIETTIQELRVTLSASTTNTCYAGVANYDTGMWEFGDETFGTRLLPIPAAGEWVLHSPGGYCYVALVVMKGQAINVSSLVMTFAGNPPPPPIFDQFEPNDTLTAAYLLTPGSYHASIHETMIPDYGQDNYDCYKVSLAAGQHLTATLRFEDYNHFDGPPNLTDLDLLVCPPGAVDPLNDFIEAASGLNIHFYPFENGHYVVPSGGDYFIVILGAYGAWDDAEYVLNVFVNAAAYSVSGTLTQSGGEPTKSLVVFLTTPGETEPLDYSETANFNALTSMDTAPHGLFTIAGVPDGDYVLKVHSNGGYTEPPYVWPETYPVHVSGGDVSGLSVNIGADP
jgi:hypothetical protein